MPRTQLSTGRKLAFTVILVALLWLLFDSLLYAALHHIGATRNLFHAPEIPSQEMLETYASRFYHPRWGWDIPKEQQTPLGSRKGRDYPPAQRYDLKIFGDSFTFGDDVGDDETFEYQYERITGQRFLNYGVGAYGTDQALLKYQDNRVATRYTLLGILDENIGRCLTDWWNFYEKGFAGTKPRYELRDGQPILLPNPITSRDGLSALRDPAFIDRLREHDYWHRYYAAIGAPERLQWPATWTIARHFGFFRDYLGVLLKDRLAPDYQNSLKTAKFYHLYRPGSEGLRILTAIVDEFVATARARGERPIVLLLPLRKTLDIQARFGRKPNQALIDHLEARGYPYIDVGDTFVDEDYPSYYLHGDGHFSPRGNARVARIIAARLQGSQ